MREKQFKMGIRPYLQLGFLTFSIVLAAFATSWADLEGWQIIDQGDRFAPSAWSQVEDVIVQSGNIYGGDANSTDPFKPGTLAISEMGVFSDFALRVDLRSRDDDSLGVVFRYRDPDNYYLFSTDRQRRFRRLLKMQAGRPQVLAQEDSAYEMNRWYRIDVAMVQDQVEIKVDGQLLFRSRDDAFKTGKVGLYCWGNAGSDFGGFQVTGKGPPAKMNYGDHGPAQTSGNAMLPAAGAVTAASPDAHSAAVAGAAPAGQATPHTNRAYIIGTGDILDISVWKEPSLTRQVAVLPDGTIAFPLVGMLTARGRTLADLKREIEEKITEFVPNPVLTVSVQQVNSMIIYVIGRVNRPGHFPLNSSINVLQALSMAGGLNAFAKEKEIKIFRDKAGERIRFPFNYKAVSAGESLEQNIRLERGDVIVVP